MATSETKTNSTKGAILPVKKMSGDGPHKPLIFDQILVHLVL